MELGEIAIENYTMIGGDQGMASDLASLGAEITGLSEISRSAENIVSNTPTRKI